MTETVGYSYERWGHLWTGEVDSEDDEGGWGTTLGPYFALTEEGIRRKLSRKARRKQRNQGTRVEVRLS